MPLAWLRGRFNVLELALVGPLPAEARRVMHIDMMAACTHSVMATIINFIPVILRRLGASSDQVALYVAITYSGMITVNFSVWLMRRWGMRAVARLGWWIGRGSFVLAALVSDARGLLAVLSIFWVLEHWPSPAYLQTMQTVYPAAQRGRMMALVRMALGVLMVVFTPVAGWILDRFGFRVLLPLAALSGVGSAIIFSPVIPAGPPPESPAAAAGRSGSLWSLLRANPRFTAYLAGMLLFGLGSLAAAPLLPLVQVDRLNLSYTVLGWLGLVQSAFWLLGYLFGGRLVDRWGGARSLQLIFVVNMAVIAPYIWAGSAWALLPAFIASGLVSAGVDLFGIYAVIQLADPERIPEFTAANSLIIGLRGLASPFIGPALLRAGLPLPAVLALATAVTLLSALAISPAIAPSPKRT